MFDNHVKLEESVWLLAEEEEIVMDTVAWIVHADKLNVLACNICGDHLHLLLVCAEEAVPKIVQKIKSMTARACNIAMGRTREHAPVRVEHTPPPPPTREHAPLQCREAAPLQGRGTTQYHLWTQKFHTVAITSSEQLQNTIHYIEHNRVKHELPESKKLLQLTKQFCCTIQHAFRTEYGGGFDVVVGNPPYGAALDESSKTFIKNNYKSYQYKFETYLYFIERGICILNSKGIVSFITPELFLRLDKSEAIRKYIRQNSNLIYLKFFGENVFSDVSVNSVVFILRKEFNATSLILETENSLKSELKYSE